MNLRRSPLIVAAVLVAVTAAGAQPPTGAITRHVWTGITGSTLTSLTSLPTYPNSPSQTGTLNSFDAPRDIGDNYGSRVFGWVHPPVTGNYRFYIHSDDNSELWLSTTSSPDDRRRIAGVPGWTPAGSWATFADQTSAVIPLEAGKYYFIEAIHKEGAGGDHLGVGWTYPGQSSIAYIPGNRLSAWTNLPPVAANDSLTLAGGGSATLRVLDNDFDPNGSADLNPASVAITSPPSQGSVTVRANGAITYAHNGSSTGTDSFQYAVRDKAGLATSAVVSLVLSDAPRLALATARLPANPPPQQISLVNAFPNIAFSSPLAIATPPGETHRLFVVEKGGDIEVIPDLSTPALPAQPFLNLDAIVNARATEVFQSGGEQGLLGLAFHPDYATNRRFFVFYSVNINGARHQRISEFAASSTNPNLALTSSEKVFIQQADDYDNHNGGDLHFGPDGYLYASLGDEGGQNDAGNNAQRIDKDFLSGIIRIDVNVDPANFAANPNLRPNNHPAVVLDTASGNPRYKVPADNPWVGAASFNGLAVVATNVRTEFWAVGLRNPWRFSFDAPTGELWCGDVGGGSAEEINRITRGGNYEWAFREGNGTGPKWNQRPSGWTGANPPFYAYSHGDGPLQGRSVTGGVIYRGSRMPSLTGRYVFADYVSGNVWSLDPSATQPAAVRIAGEGGIAGFGHDPSNGDVLIADLGGQIRRLVSQTVDTGYPATLSETGLFADVATLAPNPGLVEYDVNLPFWSDHAKKRRWFGLPDPTSKVTFSKEDAWTTPAGMIWVKHFDMEMQRGNPATAKRLETRVFVRNATGAYGVSYRWNAAGTEATLVADAGDEFDLSININGSLQTQRWRIPSRAECMTCHSPQAGHALSFRTRQLNRPGSLGKLTGNFISQLELAGYLDGFDPAETPLPRHLRPDEEEFSLESRARAWLDVNCSYCHAPGGTVPAGFDARSQVPLFWTALVNGPPQSGVLHPDDRLLVPGEPERSVMAHRMVGRNGYSRMPPLATSVIDAEGLELIEDWIRDELPARQSFSDWVAGHLAGRPPEDLLPDADPDGDGRTNRQEFLAHTLPLAVDSAPAPAVQSLTEGLLRLTFPSLPGRGLFVEHSPDLENWQPWSGYVNQGTEPAPASPLTLDVPIGNGPGFFRARIEER
jgi:uncharacterized repeat protein (TIGR03806 family)